MSGIFNTLNTANKGMNAQQTALHTTAHNISNANTEGYSRQRVELKADLAYTYGGLGQLGTGVKMDAVIRLVDEFTNKQIRQENSSLSQYATKSEVLEQMETIFNEPSDTSLNFNITEMFMAWQELAKNPENLSSKTIVIEKSNTFADTLNHMSDQISALIDDSEFQINKQVMDFNSIVDNLETLNLQIFNISVKGYVPNDLLDQRDMLLKDLSEITDFKVETDKYGRVQLSVGSESVLEYTGNKVVFGSSYDENLDPVNPPPLLDKLSSKGAVKGYVDAIEVLEEQNTDLAIFAEAIADEFNAAHNGGAPDDEKRDIFIFEDGKMKINQDIINDNNLLRAGQEDKSPEGDGSRASIIASLRDKSMLFGTETTTLGNKYNTMITKVGISKEHADNMVDNQKSLVNQLRLRRESTSGVSIDEEVSNLIKYQKAFDANAKVLQVLTEMLDVLINRTGV
ncbi:MAG: flagellar hook-associated protein FlgK [Gudongella sp.]|jgi:flagellar hook-associated protein 1 FlgK|nr:flagellar hook-associated protein FlgK [Gudongella sp.]